MSKSTGAYERLMSSLPPFPPGPTEYPTKEELLSMQRQSYARQMGRPVLDEWILPGEPGYNEQLNRAAR